MASHDIGVERLDSFDFSFIFFPPFVSHISRFFASAMIMGEVKKENNGHPHLALSMLSKKEKDEIENLFV